MRFYFFKMPYIFELSVQVAKICKYFDGLCQFIGKQFSLLKFIAKYNMYLCIMPDNFYSNAASGNIFLNFIEGPRMIFLAVLKYKINLAKSV